MQLIHGDCLIESDKIETGSVDLILTDLPYGTMNGAGLDGWENNKTGWDFAIKPKKVYEIANRILRKNGKMVLFSQEPYTSKMINEAIANIPLNYRMIWKKDHFANALIAKKAPVSYFEDILIYSKTVEDKTEHPIQEYFLNEYSKCGKSVKEICEHLGTKHASHFFTKGLQFRTPNEKYLKMLQSFTGCFNIEFGKIKESQVIFLNENRTKYPATFNLWEGNKYKSNILKYKKDYDGLHPTQKPILLLEDLIKTFSNEGDLVVDLTMGSCSTGIACLNTNRNFIGIEKDDKYFEVAKKRIEEHLTTASWCEP